jgi:ATP-binding protein involved in chromosome partitioning
VRPQASVIKSCTTILPNTIGGNVTPSTESNVNKFLNSLELPGLGRTIGDVAQILEVSSDDASVNVRIELGFPAEKSHDEYRAFIAESVRAESGIPEVNVELTTKIVAHGVQRNLKPMPDVRNIIAVASGKGGVGKSTVSVNLALALASDGASVGLLDADIYGPSQPQMMGLAGKQPESDDGKTMRPLEAHGVQVMSIGFLVDADQPMIWRGPMVTSALQQLLHQTDWDDLDYLIIDMPPGTGDIQLTLSQQVPVSGAVIVTTPQNIATLDARKGLAMFNKVSVPVLGIIENMSTHVCSNCGHEESIFGAGGGEEMARDFDVELLGQLPLDATIREQTDSGNPTVISAPDSAAARAYHNAARRMAAAQAAQGRDYSSKFPKIVVENS